MATTRREQAVAEAHAGHRDGERFVFIPLAEPAHVQSLLIAR